MATAVDTAEIARSCVVSVEASWFTFSVRSRHVPATPRLRLAAEGPFGAHLARRARDLVGEDRSWSTIVLTVFLSSRISPRRRR